MAGLIAKGVDVLVVDSAHGHSSNVIETIKQIKKKWDIDVVAGNVATEEGAADLIRAGADAVKVGHRARFDLYDAGHFGSRCSANYGNRSGRSCRESGGRSVIADGGIRYSGDISKALAAGAHCCMIGGLFAGLDESPATRFSSKDERSNNIRGMGSLGAMVKGSSETLSARKQRKGDRQVRAEGVEGRVPFKGHLSGFVYSSSAACGPAWAIAARRTLTNFARRRGFIQVSAASVRESHPHDIAITQESPNYSTERAPAATAA